MLASDLRHALRLARRTPFLTIVVTFILAGGIAVTTGVFGLVNAVWLRALPYPGADRLVVFNQSHPRLGYASLVRPSCYEWLRESGGWNEGIGALIEDSFTLGRPGVGAERVRGVRIDAELLDLLAARPIAGRSLTAGDARPGASPVALASERFWRRNGGSLGFVGNTVKVDGVETTVVGVLPYGFRVLNSAFDVFVPRPASPAAADDRALFVIARLLPGLTLEAATARLQALSTRTKPPSNGEPGWAPILRRLDAVMWGEARPAFLLLLTAALLLLALIAANVSNLLIARSEARRQEFAVRLAVGAGRSGIVRQLVTEGLVLAVTSTSLAVLLCLWLQAILIAAVPAMTDLRLDARVFGFSLSVALLLGLAFGYVPALSVLRHDPIASLDADAGSGSAARRGRPLAVFQLAAAAALLTCCGLLVRGAFAVRTVDPGFDTARLLTASISLPGHLYPSPAERRIAYERLVKRIQTLPGAVSVALTSALPLDGGVRTLRVEADDRSGHGDEAMRASRKLVSSSYFDTLGVRVMAGESLDGRFDGRSRDAAVINAGMARALWKNEAAAVGGHIRIDGASPRRVAGIVSDSRQLLSAPAAPEIYLPFDDEAPAAASVVIRTAGDPMTVARGLAEAVRSEDAEVAVSDVWPMTMIVDSYFPRPIVMAFVVLSAIALLLGALGLYAAIAFQVTSRTREFGIRLALGADSQRLLRLIVFEGLRLAAIGLIAGGGAGLALGRVLASRFAEVSVADPALAAAVAVILGGVSGAACALPARRAARLEPATALRRA